MDFSTPTSSASVSTRIPTNFAGHVAMTTPIYWTRAGQARYCLALLFPKTGIVMEVYRPQPGVQLYTGNWMSGNLRRKHDHRYPARAALCLETQHYPDSPNKPEYPSTRLNPGETFRSTTIFRFTLEA